MRIISGTYKGRKIAAPKKLPVRPTTDMAKEALFNILNNQYYFDEISVLDLFSGTGNISYEFASRGVTNIRAVDSHYGCVKFINDTAKTLEMPIQAIKEDVFNFLDRNTGPYSIIFADPPYEFNQELFSKIPELVFTNHLLKEDGCLIIEHSKHTDLGELENYTHTKKYGGNCFSFFYN